MDSENIEESSKGYFVSISIIGLLFFIFGFVTWLNGSLIPFLKIACELNSAEAYLVSLAFYISYTVMALPMSAVLVKTGYKNGMVLGLLGMAVGALIFVPAAHTRIYPVFLFGLFVMSAGLTILQTASNPYKDHRKHVDAARINVLAVLPSKFPWLHSRVQATVDRRREISEDKVIPSVLTSLPAENLSRGCLSLRPSRFSLYLLRRDASRDRNNSERCGWKELQDLIIRLQSILERKSRRGPRTDKHKLARNRICGQTPLHARAPRRSQEEFWLLPFSGQKHGSLLSASSSRRSEWGAKGDPLTHDRITDFPLLHQ